MKQTLAKALRSLLAVALVLVSPGLGATSAAAQVLSGVSVQPAPVMPVVGVSAAASGAAPVAISPLAAPLAPALSASAPALAAPAGAAAAPLAAAAAAAAPVSSAAGEAAASATPAQAAAAAAATAPAAAAAAVAAAAPYVRVTPAQAAAAEPSAAGNKMFDGSRGGEKTILVAGFQPFGEYGQNVSGAAAQSLHGARLDVYAHPADEHPAATYRIVSRVLPVSDEQAGDLLAGAMARLRPAAVLVLGLSGRQRSLEIEKIARNGSAPLGGADSYATALPADQLAGALMQAGFPAMASEDAGASVTNAAYYAALQTAAHIGLPASPILMHMPPATEQLSDAQKSAQPSWPLASLHEAVAQAARWLAVQATFASSPTTDSAAPKTDGAHGTYDEFIDRVHAAQKKPAADANGTYDEFIDRVNATQKKPAVEPAPRGTPENPILLTKVKKAGDDAETAPPAAPQTETTAAPETAVAPAAEAASESAAKPAAKPALSKKEKLLKRIEARKNGTPLPEDDAAEETPASASAATPAAAPSATTPAAPDAKDAAPAAAKPRSWARIAIIGAAAIGALALGGHFLLPFAVAHLHSAAIADWIAGKYMFSIAASAGMGALTGIATAIRKGGRFGRILGGLVGGALKGAASTHVTLSAAQLLLGGLSIVGMNPLTTAVAALVLARASFSGLADPALTRKARLLKALPAALAGLLLAGQTFLMLSFSLPHQIAAGVLAVTALAALAQSALYAPGRADKRALARMGAGLAMTALAAGAGLLFLTPEIAWGIAAFGGIGLLLALFAARNAFVSALRAGPSAPPRKR